MGLFSMACSGLSVYIWTATAYHVYQPLSNSISAATPSPSSLFSFLQHAVLGSGEEAVTPHTSRRPRRRKQLTLAEAQREQLRDSLKILVIWLLCKGVEPMFDNTLGYVVPLYNALKMIALLVFARFRTQLSLHLFDSFVVPLGRPNTPLINSTAFTALVLPTLRFMLSLPFAHLTVAIKNIVAPYMPLWTGPIGEGASIATAEETQNPAVGLHRLVPPPKSSEVRRPTTVIRRDHRPGSGESGDGGGGSHALKSKRSIDSLASSRPSTLEVSARQRSVSSRTASATQQPVTLAQLQELPSVPRTLPRTGEESKAPHHPEIKIAALPATFAHIPQSSIRQQAHIVAPDIVPPPSARRPMSHLAPAPLFSPRMPGFLGGGSGAPPPSILAGQAPRRSDSASVQGFYISGGAGDESVLASRSTAPRTPLVSDSADITPNNTVDEANEFQSESAQSKQYTTSIAKGKRKADDDDTTVTAANTTTRTRSSPGKRTRTKGDAIGATTTKRKRNGASTAAAEGATVTSTTAAKKSPTSSRTRTKPTSRAASTEPTGGTSTTASSSRVRRKAD